MATGHVFARLTKGDYWKRCYLPLLACFRSQGRGVEVLPSFAFLERPHGEDFGFFRLPWIRLSLFPKKGALIVTDDQQHALRQVSRGARVCLLVQDDYRPVLTDHEVRVPFLMHPRVHIRQIEDGHLPVASKGNPDIRLFFAGNLDEDVYDRPMSFFGIDTRFRIAKTVMESHADDCLVVRTWEDKAKLDTITKPVVIVDSFKAGLSYHEYFGLLGRAEYFLALPGISVPFCHNFAEALSMRCIPLLQFARWMSPLPLRHMQNCVEFDSLEDLSDAVDFCIRSTGETTSRLREGVEDLWRGYLDSAAIVESIEKKSARAEGRVVRVMMKTDNLPPQAVRRTP